MGLNKIILYARSVNESIFTTTLHTILTFGMFCKAKNIQMDIQIGPGDKSTINKYLKTCDRLFYFDYGVSIDQTIVSKLVSDFPENVKVMVVPTVLPTINWEKFRVKTQMGSQEPVNQRGLDFDVSVIESREIVKGVSEFTKGEGRIVAFDCKAVLKKMSSVLVLNKLKEDGIKIGVLNEDAALCHYTYECVGNILETSGIVLKNNDGSSD